MSIAMTVNWQSKNHKTRLDILNIDTAIKGNVHHLEGEAHQTYFREIWKNLDVLHLPGGVHLIIYFVLFYYKFISGISFQIIL